MRRCALLAMHPGDPLSSPLLFNSSAEPARLVSSAGAGWDGALLVEVTTAAAGEVRQDHELLVIDRRLTPLCTRPLGGQGEWTTHDPGASLRVPGDRIHAEWRGTTQFQHLFITPERVEAVLGRPWDRSGLARWHDLDLDLPFAEDVLSALRRDREAGHPAGPLVGDALVVALLAHLDAREAPPTPKPRALGRRIEHVREYVEANLARPLRLAELAALAGVGVRRFGTVFAAETGWSPHRYVLHRRIERAKSLMRDPELTLAQVALAVGFTDQSQFSRVFRRYAGEAPRSYRLR